MRDLVEIGSDEPNLADLGRPRLVSVKDRDGNVIIDRATNFDRVRRYDSHRVAARMATRNAPRLRVPMATRQLPPTDYRLRDDLTPAKGILFAAALALIVGLIALFF
ncbi:MAG: hypothetical protein K1X53_12765 [Candidatus Sumerlaeaceae bacterium]|nr:hypothetical protein [Candidatus Sumerlaeaceae bacterium]